MYRKLVITAVAAGAIVGSGATALAVTGSSASPSAAGSSSTAAGPGATQHHRGLRVLGNHVLHGQVVTERGNGTFVTHQFARGMVAQVSRTLITVHTADNTNQQFTVTPSTTVRLRVNGKGTPGTIGDVHVGDTVWVGGTGTGTPTAHRVIDSGEK